MIKWWTSGAFRHPVCFQNKSDVWERIEFPKANVYMGLFDQREGGKISLLLVKWSFLISFSALLRWDIALIWISHEKSAEKRRHTICSQLKFETLFCEIY
jgi:hypothetical protein